MKQLVLDLNKILRKEVESNIANKRYTREKAIEAHKRFGFPAGVITDFISNRGEVSSRDYFTWFVLASLIKKEIIPDFFTDIEIEQYENERYREDAPVFPLVIEAVQIRDDQWVGKITVKELMKLRDNHLIHYNENTQRTLRRIVRGNTETYKIYVNNGAIKNIKESFLTGTYIPNMLTLNIPETSDFSYKNGKLTITEMEYFDILDGYHRYRAISDIYNQDKDFDYDMELRIVCFPEEKARQFIWQEDQKTKMRKIDSDQLNSNNAGNQVAASLNQSLPFTGKVGRNGANIDAAVLGRAVNVIFFDNKKADRKDIIATKNLLVKCGQMAEEDDPELFDRRWSYADIVTFVSASKADGDFVESWKEKRDKAEKSGLFATKTINARDMLAI